MRLLITSVVAALALAFGAGLPAQAGVINWSFSYTSPVDGISASGVITTSDVLDGGGAYPMLGISGTRTSISVGPATITGLSPYAAATNHLFPAFPWLDFGGLSYMTSSLIDYNVYWNPGHYELRSDSNPGGSPDGLYPLTLTIEQQTPEPAVLALIAMMFIGLAGAYMVRRGATR